MPQLSSIRLPEAGCSWPLRAASWRPPQSFVTCIYCEVGRRLICWRASIGLFTEKRSISVCEFVRCYAELPSFRVWPKLPSAFSAQVSACGVRWRELHERVDLKQAQRPHEFKLY